MKKSDVIEFFDRCAPFWDENMVRNETVIAEILDYGGICPGVDVLDVACGTGVLFPDYIKRNVNSLTGIDISPAMISIAQEKFPSVNVVCGDVEQYPFDQKFDAVMVYNAFPHFPDSMGLIRVLATLLKPSGRLTIAHGMSREQLLRHHSGAAQRVSIELIHEDELAGLMEEVGLCVDHKISDSEKYVVSGRKHHNL